MLAAALGIPLGLMMGRYRLLDEIVTPLFEAYRYVAPLAWVPFAVPVAIGMVFSAYWNYQTFFVDYARETTPNKQTMGAMVARGVAPIAALFQG